jgi:hypothetical protein
VPIVRSAAAGGFVSFSSHSPAEIEGVIDGVIADFAELRCEFEWKVYEHDQPSDLRERLQRRGLDIGEAEELVVLPLAAASAAARGRHENLGTKTSRHENLNQGQLRHEPQPGSDRPSVRPREAAGGTNLNQGSDRPSEIAREARTSTRTPEGNPTLVGGRWRKTAVPPIFARSNR